MHKHPAVLTVALAAVLASSCTDSDARLTAPGPLLGLAAPSFSITPTEVNATTQLMRSVPRSSCPAHAPFTIRVFVTVRANGIPGLRITRVRVGFLDTFGVRMPQVTVPAPLPMNEFGTMLVDTRDGTRFPLDVGVGCGTGTTGTLSVWVDTRDDRGDERTGHLQVLVR